MTSPAAPEPAVNRRRYGNDSAKSRELLLDAAEELMCESGYAAVSSRKLASRAGLKPQLVHYYFPTMDDLFLAMFRRVRDRTLAGLEAVLAADDPLRALWETTANRKGVVLSYEFVGLANHRKAFREEVAEFGDRQRAMKINIIHRIVQDRNLTELPFTPSFAVVLLDSLARNLALETQLGVHAGHAEAFENIERFFQSCEAKSREPARAEA